MLYSLPEILTSKDIMCILSISKNTLYHLIHTNQLPAFRLGPRSWRFKKEDLEYYLQYEVENE